MTNPPCPDDITALTRMRERLVEEIRHQTKGDPPAEPAADGSWPDLNPDEASPSNWAGRTFLLRSQALASAGRHEAARRTLRWWGARDPLNMNWWHNQIGTPRLIAETLLLGDEPDDELRGLAGRVLDRSGDFLLSPDGSVRAPCRWTGANQLWMCINRLYAAVLFRDPSKVPAIIADAMAEVRMARRDEEGMQIDGSFHQHGPLLYNGGYGSAFLADCGFFIAATRTTHWLPAEEKRRLLVDHLLEGIRWMLRGVDVNPSCSDRNITRPVRQTAANLDRMARLLAETGTHRREELIDLARAIDNGKAPGSLTGNRMFHRSDFMVHQGTSFGMSVRMHSRRTKRGESING